MFDFLLDYKPVNITILKVDKHNCPSAGTIYLERTVLTYEFDFVTWGEGMIITDGDPLHTKSGRLFFRNPGDVVQGIAPYYSYYLTFELQNQQGQKYKKALPYPRYTDLQTATINNMTAYFQKIYDAFLHQDIMLPFIESTMIANVFIELWEVYRQKLLTISDKSISDTLQSIKQSRQWMNTHYSASITLPKLAEQANLSQYHYCREFKKLYSQTPMICLADIRILHVKQQLLHTKKPVTTIMLDVGFQNESHFYKTFKMKVGMTPTVYRKKYRLPF